MIVGEADVKLAILLLIAAAGLSIPQEIDHRTPPKPIHTTQPEYTKEALAAKLQGVVVLSFLVRLDGVPTDIELIRGLGKGLNEKAAECLRQWRFSPATNHGEPIRAKATVEIVFRLQD
jgi:periplasmic protein TonB